ncbi:Uncharacterised protein [Klebsiella aerogenes]|nr:Uncharacterised protein [Klebsiella aerogenes]
MDRYTTGKETECTTQHRYHHHCRRLVLAFILGMIAISYVFLWWDILGACWPDLSPQALLLIPTGPELAELGVILLMFASGCIFP